MKHTGKRALSVLCTLAMLLSLMAIIVPGAQAAATNEIDAIPSGHLAAVRYYSDFATEDGKTAYVDDAEAYGGKAVCYSLANFDGGDFLAIKRYDGGKEVTIAQMFKGDLNINDGYHTYKITYDVPADATEGAVFFIMPNWQLNSSAFCKDFAPYAGETVEVYLSIKVTGPAANGLYSVSVDRVALATLCDDYFEDGICTKCGKQDALLAGIPSEHLASVRYYSDFATEAGKTAYVDDAEAYGGKAVCYSLANFDGGDFLAIKRYDGGKEVSIAQMFKGDLNINDGYHTYKITYDVPADATEGAVFFIMPNWQLNSSAFCKDFAPYAGETVEVYLSIKVTGPAANGLYSVSVDRVALATVCKVVDGVCGICGKTDPLLSKIPADHLKSVRDYTAFNTAPSEGTNYVDDAEAFGGKAVRYSKTALNDSSFVSINRYDVASGLSDGHPSLKIGAISNDVLKASIGTGYQIYKFTYNVPAETTAGNVLYIMNNWQLNSSLFCADFAAYAGETVDVYFSIKVSGPDGNGHYSIFVDRVALATACNYDANGVCTECGKRISYTFLADDFTLPYAPFDSVVEDSDSSYGKAAKLSYADRVAAGDAGLLNSMLRISTQTLDMKSYLADPETYVDIGSISIGRLNENSGNGYVTYTFKNVVPVPTNDNFFLYVFDCWGFQVKLTETQRAQLAGKSMDVSLSMKVEGDVTDSGNPPTYYIDKVVISAHMDEDCAHGKTGVGLISDALHGTECYLCGEILSTEEHTFGEGVENGDTITFTCSGCGYTRSAVIEKPVTGWNLELDGNISLKFVLNVTAEEAAAATVSVTVNDETTTKNVADLASGEQYILIAEVAAAQMNDAITVTLNKNGQAISKDYSVRAYADYILDEANGYNTATKNLVKYMLVYGAASQNYFDYNTENLADAGIEAAPAAVPTTGGVFNVSGSAAGVEFYGVSLVFRNKIAARIYFTGAVSGKTFTVNGKTAQLNSKGDLYYIEVADIYPWDLDNGITVAVDGLTVTYAPMDYIIRMYAKGGKSAALVQALYGYYLAAEDFLLS